MSRRRLQHRRILPLLTSLGMGALLSCAPASSAKSPPVDSTEPPSEPGEQSSIDTDCELPFNLSQMSVDDMMEPASPSLFAFSELSAHEQSPHGDVERRGKYKVLPDVQMPKDVEQRMASIASAYHERTGKKLVITSGTRGPLRQANAMYILLTLGTDVVALYKHKDAAQQLADIFEDGRANSQDRSTIVANMAALIRQQMAKGIYISAHLRAGAVDVRNRNMTAKDKAAFHEGVREVGGVSILEEQQPPHFHLQVK